MKKSKGKNVSYWVLYGIMAVLVFLCCYPIVFLIVGSLMGQGEITRNLAPVLLGEEGYAKWSLLPYEPTLQSYVEILLDTPGFFVMFWNSVKITGGILLGQILVGVPAAWGFARFRFRFHDALFFLYVVLMMMPFQVMMLSDYLVLNQMNLLDTLGSVILPGIFSTLPVFIIYHFFRDIPDSLIDSARIDGAGELRIFLLIGIPLGKADIVSAIVLQFLECWSMIEQPMTFIKTQSLWPLALFLPEISSEKVGAAFVSSVITLIPSILVFLSGYDDLERGIQGFTKG